MKTEALGVRFQGGDDFRDYTVERLAQLFRTAHDVIAINRAGKCLVFHLLFYCRDVHFVNALRRPHPRDGNDESAQFISRIKSFLEQRLARDALVIRVRKNRPADFFTPALIAQPRHPDERVPFGQLRSKFG